MSVRRMENVENVGISALRIGNSSDTWSAKFCGILGEFSRKKKSRFFVAFQFFCVNLVDIVAFFSGFFLRG